MSPSSTASKNRVGELARASRRDASNRGLCSSTCRRARTASWRQLSSVLSTMPRPRRSRSRRRRGAGRRPARPARAARAGAGRPSRASRRPRRAARRRARRVGQQRLGQPLADVALASRTRPSAGGRSRAGSPPPRGRPSATRSRRLRRRTRPVVAQERLLDDVLGLADAARASGRRSRTAADADPRRSRPRAASGCYTASRASFPDTRPVTPTRDPRGWLAEPRRRKPSRQLRQAGSQPSSRLRLGVRRAADLRHHRDPDLADREPRDPGRHVARRPGAQALGQVRQPLRHRRGLVVDDVVDAGGASLDRDDRRGGRVVDVEERPDAGAVADERQLALADQVARTRSPSTCPGPYRLP